MKYSKARFNKNLRRKNSRMDAILPDFELMAKLELEDKINNTENDSNLSINSFKNEINFNELKNKLNKAGKLIYYKTIKISFSSWFM